MLPYVAYMIILLDIYIHSPLSTPKAAEAFHALHVFLTVLAQHRNVNRALGLRCGLRSFVRNMWDMDNNAHIMLRRNT